MKTELKVVVFENAEELVDFVNKNKISKENIQSISSGDTYGISYLFYWEISE